MKCRSSEIQPVNNVKHFQHAGVLRKYNFSVEIQGVNWANFTTCHGWKTALIKFFYLRAHKKNNLMNKNIIALAICFCTVALLSCEGQKSKPVNLKTQADSVSYSIGVSI